jgi:endonuclease YncB( thermonuclease family)
MNRVRSSLAIVCLLALCLPTQARRFEGVVTHVTDGDSIWVRPDSGGEARDVRLQGIDAPEICQAFGVSARNALAAHALHRRVTVNSRARDKYERTLGRVSLNGEDLGAWMVARGYAWSYHFHRHTGPYGVQEERARSARLGLWADGRAIEPRQFRKQHGSCR